MATSRVNLTKLRVEFQKQVVEKTSYQNLARGAALSRVRASQGAMVNAFESNQVTQELEGGADYSGPSVITYHQSEYDANLYSFIGFPAGTNPVEVLRRLLQFPIDVKLSTRIQNKYYFIVLNPTVEDIENATPMPTDYAGGTFSWARGVEDGDGLLGIGNFLSIKATGRSLGGIQVKVNTALNSSIKKTPYITEILEAFRKRLEQLI